MTKIKCMTLGGPVPSQDYTTPKGNIYTFQRRNPVEIRDPEDVLHFLNAGPEGDKYFLLVDDEKTHKSIIKKLKDAIKKRIVKEEEVAEDAVADETIGPYTPQDHYGLSEEEYDDAVKDGVYDEVEIILGKDPSLAKKELDVYAEKFDIKLNRSKTISNMNKDFWDEWKKGDAPDSEDKTNLEVTDGTADAINPKPEETGSEPPVGSAKQPETAPEGDAPSGIADITDDEQTKQ